LTSTIQKPSIKHYSIFVNYSLVPSPEKEHEMFQQIVLVGRLGNDPEMRYTPSGVPVTTFSLAVNRTWTNQEGQRQDKTTWFRVTVWRKQAEIVSQYLTKGRQVLVVGEVEEARPWTDRDGNVRASLEVTANTVRFLGTRADADMQMGASGGTAESSAEPGLGEEDIPF
jgi:single-strand DNA-binding protein